MDPTTCDCSQYHYHKEGSDGLTILFITFIILLTFISNCIEKNKYNSATV